MLPAYLPPMLLLTLALPGAAADLIDTTWTGIAEASVVVVGNGVVSYDADLIRHRIELELHKVGLSCIDIDLPSPGMPRVTIVAHVDGMPLRTGSGTSMGFVYHWSLSASCWANQVAGGSGMVILEEHHDLGYGSANVLPDGSISDFSQLATHMAMHWLRDNPH
jgi:hypothetical protein